MCTKCLYTNISHILTNFCIHFAYKISCHSSFNFVYKMYTKVYRNMVYILYTFCIHFAYISCINLVQLLYTKCIHSTIFKFTTGNRHKKKVTTINLWNLKHISEFKNSGHKPRLDNIKNSGDPQFTHSIIFYQIFILTKKLLYKLRIITIFETGNFKHF